MGSSYKLWDKRLRENNTLTRGQITQFCNAIAAGAKGFYIGGHRTNLTGEECAILADTFFERCEGLDGGGFKLEPEHEKFGLQWLKSDKKRALECGVSEHVLETFQGFRFVGYRVDITDHWSTRANIIPIYRVLYEEGERPSYVEYSWSPWQAKAYA